MTNTASVLEIRAGEILSRMEESPEPQATPGEISGEEFAFYGELTAKVGPSSAKLLRGFGKRRVILDADGSTAESPVGSYVGGHPFVSVGEEFLWPMGRDGISPMTFLMQVNFAELPRLKGFPESGLLQWWIEAADDFMGLSFDDDATGREGLLVKFYPEAALSAAASAPSKPIPQGENEENYEFSPLGGSKPFALSGRELLSVPDWEESTIEKEILDFFIELRKFFELSDWTNDHGILFEPSSQLGGYPSFAQGDPRNHKPNPQQLILQLSTLTVGHEDVLTWGDAGTAQLFGDLDGLRRGDVTSCWWDWACG